MADIWDSFRSGQQAMLAPQQANIQQVIGLQGILAGQMKMHQDAQLRDALARGDMNALRTLRDGIDILGKLATQQNIGITGALHSAQLQEIMRKGAVADQEQKYKAALIPQLTQSQYSGTTAPDGPAPVLFANDQAAEAALRDAEARGVPFRGDVNNPNVTRALVAGAGNSLPTRSAVEILRNLNGPAGMTEFQKLSTDLRAREQTIRNGNLAARGAQVADTTGANPVTPYLTPRPGGQSGSAVAPSVVPDAGAVSTPIPSPSVVTPGELPAKSQRDIAVTNTRLTNAQVVKGLEENYTRLRDAPQQLESIEKAKTLIPDSRVFQGPLGQQKLAVVKFFNANTPFKIDMVGVQSAEELRTRIFMNVMDNLKKMDAAPSQLQQQIMQESLGNLGTDADALPKVLDAYGDAIRDKVGLFKKQVGEAEQAGIRWPHKIDVPAKPAAAGAPKRISGDADFNALPSGALFIGPDGKTRTKP